MVIIRNRWLLFYCYRYRFWFHDIVDFIAFVDQKTSSLKKVVKIGLVWMHRKKWRIPIFGYFRVPIKIPNSAKWDKSQPGNSQPSSLIGTCLTLPNLGFLWVFFKYPKISKNGNLLFFPVLQTTSICFHLLFHSLWIYASLDCFESVVFATFRQPGWGVRTLNLQSRDPYFKPLPLHRLPSTSWPCWGHIRVKLWQATRPWNSNIRLDKMVTNNIKMG